jgi:hypothetical protein
MNEIEILEILNKIDKIGKEASVTMKSQNTFVEVQVHKRKFHKDEPAQTIVTFRAVSVIKIRNK